jgi:hypothetical protein
MKRILLPLLLLPALASAQVSFTGSYSENFDSMGTGTAAPTGWTFHGALGGSGSTWSTSIPTSGTNSAATPGTENATLVVNSNAASATATSNTVGYNFALSTSTTDRCVGTSPTSGAGLVWQLRLTNNTSGALSQLRVGYDIRRFTTVSTAEALPGYQLFVSTDSGTTWSNVAALNPVLSGGTVNVPSSSGVTTVSPTTITLPSSVAVGGEIRMRWIDDNGPPSPDQIIGLDNVTVQVAQAPPTVSLTAPAPGATIALPSSITLQADAADSNGSITKVEFFAGSTLLGQDTEAPYEFSWTNAISGNYSLTARATDNDGATTTSSAVLITVTNPNNVPPTAALTSPANNATLFSGTIALAATAADTDGIVSKVEFFHGATKLGEDTASPYTFNWTGVTPGSYTLTAVATDNDGAVTTSRVVAITVVNPISTTLVSRGATWKYLDDGSNQGTAWKESAFDDSAWASGPAKLGYADTPMTVLRQGPDGMTSTSKYITYYFRRTFTLSGAAAVQQLNMNVLRDDGAVIYINGTEVARQNMPAGAVNHLTESSTIVSGADETTFFLSTANPLPVLNEGLNVIAVEIHQRDSASSDLSFDMDLISLSPPGPPPAVAITAPANNAMFSAPASINITADATDSDGTVTKVEFFNGATKLGETSDAPYSFAWNGVAQGTYTLTAVATDNNAQTTTSVPINITVSPPLTTPPTVSITSPADGANFIAPATITINANASDSDGTVTKVEFFQGTTKLGETSNAPYTFTWNNVPVGTYTLIAKATDDMTASTTSSAVTVNVAVNQPPTITLSSPANLATGIGTGGNVTLTADVADPENQPLTVTFYGRPKSAPVGPDFTLVTIPDTQFYSQNTNNRIAFFNSQTNWIVTSKNTLNTQFVAHMGDMTQEYNTIEAEFQRASAAMAFIEDPATTMLTHGIPWGGAPGNHDIGSGGNTSFWNQYFGLARWAGRPYFGGGFNGVSDNNYQFFSASGLDFIVINLAYNSNTAGNQAVMDWADALLKAHPNRRAIVTSHWLIGTSFPPTQAAWGGHGQALYDNLKDNPNLFLMLCGHIHGEGRRADVYEGRTVNTILQDYQSRANGGDSWLRYYVFSPANNTITAKTLQTTTGTFETDADSEFTLAYDMGAPAPWTALGTVNASGGTASLNWTGVTGSTEYEWYAAVSDGTNNVGSTTRSFTTAANAAPTVTLTSPADGATIALPATVNFTADANDSDGTIAKVEFYAGATKVGESTTSPYVFSWTAISGSYALTAVATDTQGATATSAVVNVTVTNPANIPPTVAITAPAPGASVTGTAVLLQANATDTDGTISKVEFFHGAAEIGETTTSPYSATWSAVAAGNYTITAVATDNDGGTTTSAPVSFNVQAVTDLTFQDGLNGYSGTIDTLVRSDSTAQDTAYGSDPSMSIDGDDGSPDLAPNHGLIRFENIIGAGVLQIPAGSTITSATLTFTVTDPGSGMNVHRMLAPWSETSTWNSLVNGIQTDDIQASSAAIATVGANNSSANVAAGPLAFNVTAAVQAWANGAQNHGLALLPFAAGTNGIDVCTREFATVASRPKLDVTFVRPPTVDIAATDGTAGEYGADQALSFTISRTGSIAEALTVPFIVGGSATAGADYTSIPASVIIPATQSSVSLPLTVLPDDLAEGVETITLAPGTSLNFIAGTSALATIADHPAQDYFFLNITDPAKRGAAMDADGDTKANIIEYFMGTLPGDANSHGILEISSTAANTFKVRYPRAKNRPAVSGSLRWSSDLVSWHAGGESDGTWTVTFAESVVSASGEDPETVEATATITGATAAPKIFVHLSVQ